MSRLYRASQLPSWLVTWLATSPSSRLSGCLACWPASYLAIWFSSRLVIQLASFLAHKLSGQQAILPAGLSDQLLIQVVSLVIPRFPAHFFVKKSGKIVKIIFLDSRHHFFIFMIFYMTQNLFRLFYYFYFLLLGLLFD